MRMSEYIKDGEKEIVDYLIQLKLDCEDNKISIEDARKEILNKYGKIKPQIIAVVEQNMKKLDNGIKSKSDIQSLIDLFDGVIDYNRPELAKNHPINRYYMENDALEEILLSIEDLVQYPLIKNQWLEIYDKLKEYKIHLSRKQNQLYSVLEKKGFDRPTKVMWLVDDTVYDEIKEARSLLDNNKDDEFINYQKMLVQDIRELMDKENSILYPTSLMMISEEEFEDMKLGDSEIGFSFINVEKDVIKEVKPKDKNNSLLLKDLQNLLKSYGGFYTQDTELDVSTGKLTLEQINLIFRHMPVDLSFVDENDIVKFYSDTKHRVFPRSKNVIGRDVKNCHPRTSVHIVEEIIDKFKNGNESFVEFWINKPEIFIYINYTAVRDDNGKFRGVLEMMQDCTHIRSLEGSQTLLTWSNKNIINEDDCDRDNIKVDKNIVLNKDTKLKDLLEAYPFLKNELPKINSKFMMINSPLAKIIIKQADIAMMCERSGMKVEELIEAINKVINEK